MISHRYNDNYYDSAGINKKSFREWTPGRGVTGDDESIYNQKPITARVWDLIRNNPKINSILTTLSSGVIGTGLKVCPQIDYKTVGITKKEAKKLNSELSLLFDSWAKSEGSTTDRKNNFYMLQTRLYLNYVSSGDCFGIFRNNSNISRKNKYPFDLTIEGVDSNMCCNPVNQLDTNTLAGGIEVNQYGEEIAYYFRKLALNDLSLNNNWNYETTRVPKYGSRSGRRNVIHIHTPLRFNERRGVSVFAPILESMKQLDRYEKSELMATIISSYFTAFIKTEFGDGINMEKNQYDEPTLSSGGISRIGIDEDIVLANPNRPNANFASFMGAYDVKMASVVGLSAEMVDKKYTSSYTAARAALNDVYALFLIKREEISFLLNQPAYEELITECVLKGRIVLPGFLTDPAKKAAYLKTSWVGSAMGDLDPVKTATSARIMRQEHIKSSDQITREITGQNYMDTLEQLDDENQERQERDMLFNDEYDRETERFDAQRKIEDSEKVEDNNSIDNSSTEDNSQESNTDNNEEKDA